MTDFAFRRTMMVDTQVRPSDVTKFPIIDAMLSAPRERFVPDSRREAAYVGENMDLGEGRVILEPLTMAKMLDAMNIGPSDLVLDLGPALGYSTALLSRLAEAVVGVEENEAWAAEAESALSEVAADNAVVVTGAIAEGAAKHGPYDAIFIQGGIETLPPSIEAQLKEGGRIAAVFMEGALGVCRIGHMLDGKISWRFSFNASAPVLPGFERAREFSF